MGVYIDEHAPDMESKEHVEYTISKANTSRAFLQYVAPCSRVVIYNDISYCRVHVLQEYGAHTCSL